MTAQELKCDGVYRYTDHNKSIDVMYYGMSGEGYLFIPYNKEKGHYNGIPNALTESEVSKHIKNN